MSPQHSLSSMSPTSCFPLCLLLFIVASSVFECPSVSYEAGDGWGIFDKRVLPKHSSRKTDTLLPIANVRLLCPLLLVGLGGGPSFSEVPPLGIHIRAICFKSPCCPGQPGEVTYHFRICISSCNERKTIHAGGRWSLGEAWYIYS